MFCFASLDGARERSRSHPSRAFGAVSRRAKIPSPQPSRDFFHTGVWGGIRAGSGLIFFAKSPEFTPVKLARRISYFSLKYTNN
jgi:hypothetical protein